MKREIRIGIFTVLMIACAWGGIRFLSGIDLFRRNSDYYAVYDQSNGVQKASLVVVNGVKVGNVTDIKLTEDRRKVVVRLTISNKYFIPSNSEAKIFSSSLMGSKAINITLGDSDTFLVAGDTIRSGFDKDIMDVAGSELDFLKERIDLVTNDLSRTLTNINSLLESNAKSITSTASNLNSLTAQTTKLMSDNESHINQIIESFTTVSQAIGSSAPQIDSIIGNLSVLTSQLNDADVAGAFTQSLNQINTLITTLNDENGSINKLMSDGALYDNVSSASGHMDSLLMDVKENPWRYVNFSLFGRNEYKQRAKMEAKQQRAESRANN